MSMTSQHTKCGMTNNLLRRKNKKTNRNQFLQTFISVKFDAIIDKSDAKKRKNQ